MRLTATLMFMLCTIQLKAQSDEVLLTARRLPLDTLINGAQVFNNELLNCTPGFSFQFVDRNSSNELKYLYEHTNHETLKIEYTYRNRTSDSSDKPRPLIFSQRIVAEKSVITQIYNCVFGESIKADQLEAFAGFGLGFVYREKDYHYSLTPDDYKPGYWVLMFTE
jgi:hypothetical protein